MIDNTARRDFQPRVPVPGVLPASSAMKASSTIFVCVCALSSVGEPAARIFSIVHGDERIKPLGLFHVGGRNDHAHAGAARPDTPDQFPELPSRQRINAGRRLVEDQKVGVMNERAAKPQLLPHAA